MHRYTQNFDSSIPDFVHRTRSDMRIRRFNRGVHTAVFLDGVDNAVTNPDDPTLLRPRLPRCTDSTDYNGNPQTENPEIGALSSPPSKVLGSWLIPEHVLEGLIGVIDTQLSSIGYTNDCLTMILGLRTLLLNVICPFRS